MTEILIPKQPSDVRAEFDTMLIAKWRCPECQFQNISANRKVLTHLDEGGILRGECAQCKAPAVVTKPRITIAQNVKQALVRERVARRR